jgi:photosystem II stability/assembly factor-like uncharacterized protein
MLLIGTSEGVYRAPINEIDDATHVLTTEPVLRVHRFGDTIFVATRSGLFRSADGGETWSDLGVPRREVYSVVASPDGERLYAGTHPAHLYVSTDDGGSWRELDGFQNLPSRETWHTPRHRNEAHIRSLGVHSDAPERVIAGVEVGGVHISDDGGETWTERRNGLPELQGGLQYDVHHVLVFGAEEYVVSCGGGLYRTRDGGQSWSRLDTDIEQTYFREAFAHDGRLYAAARGPPWTWRETNGADTALFESRDSGETLAAVTYPGSPAEFVLAWTVLDGRVVAGTSEGRVITREDDGWTMLGRVPVGIRSLGMS